MNAFGLTMVNTNTAEYGIKFTPDNVKCRVTTNTKLRQWASTNSKMIKTLAAGIVVQLPSVVEGQNVAGESTWFVMSHVDGPIQVGGRMWSGTAEKD